MPNNTLQRTNLQLYRLRWDMDSFPGGYRYHAIMPTTAFATKVFEEQQKRSKSKVQPAGNLWPALMALMMAWMFHAEQQQNAHHTENLNPLRWPQIVISMSKLLQVFVWRSFLNLQSFLMIIWISSGATYHGSTEIGLVWEKSCPNIPVTCYLLQMRIPNCIKLPKRNTNPLP